MHARLRAVFVSASALLFILLSAALVFDEVAGPDALATIFTPTTTAHFSDTAILAYAHVFGSTSTRDHFFEAAGQIRSSPRQHALMHAIGHMLYIREGTLTALAMCPTAYATGCLHEVVGQSLYENYGEIPDSESTGIRSLFSLCATVAPDNRGACSHAVGHGLMFVARYDVSQMSRALAQCDTLHERSRALNFNQNCYVGVFMEYNEHNMQDYAPRAVDPDTIYAPCDTLTSPFHQKLCIAWQVPLIHGTFDGYHFTTESIDRLGTFCRGAPKNAQQLCFLSLGRSLSFYQNLPPQRAWEYCAFASASVYKNTIACAYEVGAAIDERVGGSFRSELCQAAQDPEECLRYTDMIPNEAHRSPGR